jgi:predicted DNA-binding antitoxin AbrB/MazE fold protein
MSTIQAVYENGVFKPKEPVHLPEGSEVTVETNPPEVNEALEREIRRLTSRTPDEIMAARERILYASPPARPLPEGKTHAEVVQALWPGDETDEQVREALEKLS